jgi:hypothetical protein
MITSSQLWSAVGTLAVIFISTVIFQTHHTDKRLDDLRSDMNARFADFQRSIDKRFDDLRDWVRSEIKAAIDPIHAELKAINGRLDRLEERVAKIEDKLEVISLIRKP